jgi:hypothetical protein
MGWDAAIAAAAQIVGGVMDNRAKASMATDQHRATFQYQASEHNYGKMMSDSAHQRQVADLRAAGINPILSAKLGGASTPSGPGGSMVQGQTAGNFLGQAANTAINAYQAESNVNKQSAEVEQINQNVRNLKASEGLTDEQTKKVSSEIYLVQEQANKTWYETRHTAEKLETEDYKNTLLEVVADYLSSAGAAEAANDAGLVTPHYVEIVREFFVGLARKLGKGQAHVEDFFGNMGKRLKRNVHYEQIKRGIYRGD